MFDNIMTMTVLVTGCAGYIGSVTAKVLVEDGFEVLGIDDLSTGFADNVPSGVDFYPLNIGDKDKLLSRVIGKYNIDSIIHCAGFIDVNESVTNPTKYFDNNVTQATKFLELMIDSGVKSFVYSSTAAVYGNPKTLPVKETAELLPVNPYGETKLEFERVLKSRGEAAGLNYIIFRYFNVSGSYKGYGECHDPETHLIPLVIDTALGKRDAIWVYGRDYPTRDGTTVRDYIHVRDLADAHVKALQALKMPESKENTSLCNRAYNLGCGEGFTVLEIIEAVKKVTGRDFKVIEAGRRNGDPHALVADPSNAVDRLKWTPKLSDLIDIVRDVYEHRKGYIMSYERNTSNRCWQ